MKPQSNGDSIEALKNMLSEVDLILSTTEALPRNRTPRCRELLGAALALPDHLAKQQQGSSAAALGSKGGSTTAQRHGAEHYRMMAAARQTHGGGRPPKKLTA
jgi:uncharacterized protein (DUF2252 family)